MNNRPIPLKSIRSTGVWPAGTTGQYHQPACGNLSARVRRLQGFTMIEVMIVVAIIGILAAIAVPSYSQYMVDSRRTDAITFLSEAAGEQVRYFSSNNQYADSMDELGYGTTATVLTPEGHYSVGVANPGGRGKFVLTATPVVGGKQAGDTECASFTISDTGVKKNTGTNTDCW